MEPGDLMDLDYQDLLDEALLIRSTCYHKIMQHNTSQAAEVIMKPILVLDTNVLLSDLKLIKAVINLLCDFLFIIPWIVFEELDIHKNRKSRTAEAAQLAIRFIQERLGNGIIGQRADQNFQDKWNANSNDDLILDCCLYFKNEQLVLLSNDENVKLKAKVMNIPSMSTRQNNIEAFINDLKQVIPVAFQSNISDLTLIDGKMKLESGLQSQKLLLNEGTSPITFVDPEFAKQIWLFINQIIIPAVLEIAHSRRIHIQINNSSDFVRFITSNLDLFKDKIVSRVIEDLPVLLTLHQNISFRQLEKIIDLIEPLLDVLFFTSMQSLHESAIHRLNLIRESAKNSSLSSTPMALDLENIYPRASDHSTNQKLVILNQIIEMFNSVKTPKFQSQDFKSLIQHFQVYFNENPVSRTDFESRLFRLYRFSDEWIRVLEHGLGTITRGDFTYSVNTIMEAFCFIYGSEDLEKYSLTVNMINSVKLE